MSPRKHLCSDNAKNLSTKKFFTNKKTPSCCFSKPEK